MEGTPVTDPTPTDIVRMLTDNWAGTEEALRGALEQFYNDIRGSVELALTEVIDDEDRRTEVLDIVDDYAYNQYFD